MADFMTHAHRSIPDDEDPRGFWHINVYERDRHYGGPEEGGWWYDSGRFVRELSKVLSDVTEDEAHQIARDRWMDLEDDAAENDVPPVHSVMYRGGRYEVRAEQRPGADWPAERPHYE